MAHLFTRAEIRHFPEEGKSRRNHTKRFKTHGLLSSSAERGLKVGQLKWFRRIRSICLKDVSNCTWLGKWGHTLYSEIWGNNWIYNRDCDQKDIQYILTDKVKAHRQCKMYLKEVVAFIRSIFCLSRVTAVETGNGREHPLFMFFILYFVYNRCS